MKESYLKPEDYVEPRCLLCETPYGVTPPVKTVPQQRIIEKMNEYMSHRDYAGAERHLLYWLEEAKLGGDIRGELLIYNEMVGHYRKTGEKDKAFGAADLALDTLTTLEMENTISAGTTYTNVATAYNAFGENEKALTLFEKAQAVYESEPRTAPDLLGGLYNNMALVCVAQKQFLKAYALYDKALLVMDKVTGGCLEQAITYLNMANAIEDEIGMEQGEERIFSLLDKAYDLLDAGDAPHDGYYAFVCEKCAPTFSYYGYFAAANELLERSEQIYERN